MTWTPHPPDANDTPHAAVAEVASLLRENGERRREIGRDLARRLTMPLAQAIRELGEKA